MLDKRVEALVRKARRRAFQLNLAPHEMALVKQMAKKKHISRTMVMREALSFYVNAERMQAAGNRMIWFNPYGKTEVPRD